MCVTDGGVFWCCVELLNPERRRRGVPLALQGAVVMGFGLGIAYLMYKLTTEDDGLNGEAIRIVPGPDV
jgi:hypothetical protein